MEVRNSDLRNTGGRALGEEKSRQNEARVALPLTGKLVQSGVSSSALDDVAHASVECTPPGTRTGARGRAGLFVTGTHTTHKAVQCLKGKLSFWLHTEYL